MSLAGKWNSGNRAQPSAVGEESAMEWGLGFDVR